jgi:hypothetical protein
MMASLADLADPEKRKAFLDRMAEEQSRLDHEREVARFRATHHHRQGGRSAMVELTARPPRTDETIVVYQDGPAGELCALPQADFNALYEAIPEETVKQRLERIRTTGLLRDSKDIELWICGQEPFEDDSRESDLSAAVDEFFGRENDGE